MKRETNEIVIEYFNLHSNIIIDDVIKYKNFIIKPLKNRGKISGKYPIGSITVRLEMNHKRQKLFNLLNKHKSTDSLFCLHVIARSELEKLIYKLSLIFSSLIYFNFPLYLKFSHHSKLFLIKNPADWTLTKLNIDNFEHDKDFVFKEGLGASKRPIAIVKDGIKKINKIKPQHLHLCYLYHVTGNEQLDLSFRLLSAWKYLEEFVELKGMTGATSSIPKIIFDDIFNKTCINKIELNGRNEKTGKFWIHIKKYKVQFLKDFYNEIRNLIAHHKRDQKGWCTEKKYTPMLDPKADLKMNKALPFIIDFLDQMNEELFGIYSEILNGLEIGKRTSKEIKFPKRFRPTRSQ